MQLLLPSSKLAVLVDEKEERRRLIQNAFFVFGMLTVLLGGLDLLNRLPPLPISDHVLREAFEPAVLLSQ